MNERNERMKRKICVFCSSDDILIEDVNDISIKTEENDSSFHIKYTCNNCDRCWWEEG